jgi:hypothetical protein
MRCSGMDNKEKQKGPQRTRAPEKEETPIQWELTDDDKAFLRSCNISSE